MQQRVLKGSIIGAGQVGLACAYSMLIQSTFDELVLVDANRDKLEGEVMDLVHGIPFVDPTQVKAGTIADCAQSDVVIITAGAKQQPGETRLDLVNRNVDIFKSLIPALIEHCPDTLLLVVSNPVDIMTYVAWALSGLPAHQVIGSGTVLDTGRFRYLLAERFQLDPRSLHAYIIGEHGDSEVPVWSKVNVAGTPITQLFPAQTHPEQLQPLFGQVKNAAYEIIRRKGATSYAIGLGVTQIVQAIVRNQKRVLTVSSLMTGQYGFTDLCFSLPTIVGRSGIIQVLELPLTDLEAQQLQHSGSLLKEVIDSLHL